MNERTIVYEPQSDLILWFYSITT